VVATQPQFLALHRDNVVLALLAGDEPLNQLFALVWFRRSPPAAISCTPIKSPIVGSTSDYR